MDMKEGGYESWEDIDSLGKLEILAGVEEQMDINIPIDAVEHVHSLDEFVEACVYHHERHVEYQDYLEHVEQRGPNPAWALCLHDMIPNHITCGILMTKVKERHLINLSISTNPLED